MGHYWHIFKFFSLHFYGKKVHIKDIKLSYTKLLNFVKSQCFFRAQRCVPTCTFLQGFISSESQSNVKDQVLLGNTPQQPKQNPPRERARERVSLEDYPWTHSLESRASLKQLLYICQRHLGFTLYTNAWILSFLYALFNFMYLCKSFINFHRFTNFVIYQIRLSQRHFNNNNNNNTFYQVIIKLLLEAATNNQLHDLNAWTLFTKIKIFYIDFWYFILGRWYS